MVNGVEADCKGHNIFFVKLACTTNKLNAWLVETLNLEGGYLYETCERVVFQPLLKKRNLIVIDIYFIEIFWVR